MTSPGQVALSDLLFGSSWEDPDSDRAALGAIRGQSVVTIGSGGCNTFSLLLDDPARIYAVDINASQPHLLALKRAAIRKLDADDLLAFLGHAQSSKRLESFDGLDLDDDTRAYWNARRDLIATGVVHHGRFERFLAKFRTFLRLLQGKRRIERLFESESLEQQRRYFDETWNTARWRFLFRLAFNKRVLAKRGLSSDYFRFDDGSASFAESFSNRARHAFRDLPIRTNYFLAQYLLGRYLPNEVPDYVRRENLPVVRERLDRVEIITADLKEWLAARREASIDAFSLSNICELMNADDTKITFEQVARTAKPGARICFRNLMVPRDVPEQLRDVIRVDAERSRAMLQTDRSFVYSRVAAYSRA